MSIQLPNEVLDRLDQGEQPVFLEDPRSHEEYVLVPRKEYESLHGSGREARKREDATENGRVDESWNESMNARRVELVKREIHDKLTPEEKQELERLQDQMLAYRRRVAPVPIEELQVLHQELLNQAARNHRGD